MYLPLHGFVALHQNELWKHGADAAAAGRSQGSHSDQGEPINFDDDDEIDDKDNNDDDDDDDDDDNNDGYGVFFFFWKIFCKNLVFEAAL